MGRAFKYLFYLCVLLGIGLVSYALFADLSAPQSEVTQDVPLNLTD